MFDLVRQSINAFFGGMVYPYPDCARYSNIPIYKVVTAKNSGSCPNAAQYYGKLVSGVDSNLLIGAYRFPKDSSIAELEAPAKTVASSGGFSSDAILFGKWRD